MFIRTLVCIVSTAALLSLAACDRDIKVSDSDIRQVQYKELVEMMQNKPRNKTLFGIGNNAELTVVVDPRPERKFAEGHIPGAVNIPLPEIVAGHRAMAEAKNVVVYGSGWMDYTSPAAAKRLMALGYRNVFDYRGGLELWRAEGGRVESSAPAAEPADAGQ